MSIIKFLSQELSLDPNSLRNYISSSPHRYKVYKIPKRNGKGSRVIAQPAKELKYLQKLVAKKYLRELPVHESAMAYKKKTGIRDNVERHVKNKYILKMDFTNYFPSIKPNDLIAHIQRHLDLDLGEEDVDTLSRLFFYDKNRTKELSLSIGAPTSPEISNTIMYDFDVQTYEACMKNDIVYTRYADDLTLSTNTKNILFNYPNVVSKILQELSYPVLSLNSEKTVFLSPSGNRHITGLVLTNEGEISLGRKKKRYIRSLLYQYSRGMLEEEQVSYLRGYLSFCSDIEPQFVSRLKDKYGSALLERIRKQTD